MSVYRQASQGTHPEDESAVIVLPPPENLRDATAMEQLAGTLGHLPGPVALEIAGLHRQRLLGLRGSAASIRRVAAQLYSVYRQVDLQPLPAELDLAALRNLPGRQTLAAQLRTVGPEFLPLKIWREFEGGEPLDAVLGAFDGLQMGEAVLSQLIVHGEAPPQWAEPHLRRLASLKRRGYGADVPAPAGNIATFVGASIAFLCGAVLALWAMVGAWERWLLALPVGAALTLIGAWLMGQNNNQWARVLEEEAVAKLRDQALEVELRLFACAGTGERAQELLDQLISGYQLFNTTSGNRWQMIVLPGGTDPTRLSPGAGMRPDRLSVKELAGLWHMPVGESLERVLRQAYEQLLPLPFDMSVLGGAVVGTSHKGDQDLDVTLSPEALRHNILVIGKTQHGKSTFMEHVAAAWMRDPGRSVLVVDPHGDLARRAIGLVPPERAGDVVYLDLSDETRSAGLNLLDVGEGMDPDSLAETFVDVAKALWQQFWGPRMLIPLGFGLRALAHANLRRPPERQYTLLALAGLLTGLPVIRKAFLDKEVSPAERPDIYHYFEGEYAQMSASQREQIISPVLSKSHAFERTAVIRRLVGQPRSTLHLFQAIRSRKIIIVNTNVGILSDDVAGFVGSLFLNIMRRVIMRQTILPRELRVPVSVVADEFQTLTGTNFGALLGELQKNGGNFILGTQALDNLRSLDPDGVPIGGIFAGVATKVVFQVNGDDARYLVERELDIERLRAESLVNLPRYHAYVKTVSDDGRPVPVYLLKVAAPLAPDPVIAKQVLAQRDLYTVPGDEADRLARRSLTILRDEHTQPQTESNPPAETSLNPLQALLNKEKDKQPPNSPDLIRASASVASRQPAASESNGTTPEAVETQTRPKAVLPTLSGISSPPPSDEAGFNSMAVRLGRTAEDPNGALEVD